MDKTCLSLQAEPSVVSGQGVNVPSVIENKFIDLPRWQNS